MQISVVVLTYNPDSEKLLATLRSVICQQDVDYEVILSDDGSVDNRFDLAEAFLQANAFSRYQLVANLENKGTVQNCLSGLQAAHGAYVFFTSPGDLLFDSHVLKDFYDFARKQRCALCFGNAIHYDLQQNTPVLTSPYTTPANPEIYAPGRSTAFRKACYCDRSWICGAVFFRETEAARKYFQAISSTSVYTEDTPSTLWAIADNIAPVYFDRNMIFYEYGGVSAGTNSKWTQLIDEDIRASVLALAQRYPRNPYVHLAQINACTKNRFHRLLKKLCHPVLMFHRFRARQTIPPKPLTCSPSDLQRLQALLHNKY